jgi:hypothetical protein
MLRNHSCHIPASEEDSVGDVGHEANPATTVDQTNTALRQQAAHGEGSF